MIGMSWSGVLMSQWICQLWEWVMVLVGSDGSPGNFDDLCDFPKSCVPTVMTLVFPVSANWRYWAEETGQ
jgi:hypothetical protein